MTHFTGTPRTSFVWHLKLAYGMIWGCAISLGAFFGLLLDFWVLLWAVPGFLGIIFR